MLYYNKTHNHFSDNFPNPLVPVEVDIGDGVVETLHSKAGKLIWDTWLDQDDGTIESQGYQPIVEAEPVYDGSPLTGDRIRTVSEDGSAYTWTVDGVPWHDAIKPLTPVESARKQHRQRLKDGFVFESNTYPCTEEDQLGLAKVVAGIENAIILAKAAGVADANLLAAVPATQFRFSDAAWLEINVNNFRAIAAKMATAVNASFALRRTQEQGA